MARKRARRDVEVDPLDPGDDAPSRRRRPRWRRRFLAVAALVVALVVAGPTIVARTPLRNLVLGSAVPGGAARLASSAANFSWIGGQSLVGLVLADDAGKPLATVESIAVDRSLVALAANRRHLGRIVVVRPVISLETRDGGSNLEDLARRIAAAVAAQPQPLPAAGDAGPTTFAELEIVNASILGHDAVSGQPWRLDELGVTVRPGADGAYEAAGSGRLTLLDAAGAATASADAGRFKFQLRLGGPESQRCDVIADRLPLGPLEPWLARVLPGARVVGTASADLKVAWSPARAGDSAAPPMAGEPAPAPRNVTAVGKVDAADVRITAEALNGDLVELPTASLSVDATARGPRLSARQLAARSAWLQAEAAGEFDLGQLTSLSADRLPMSDATLTVRVDLPQAARMLPRTLQLRPGVRIDSGNVEATFRSVAEAAGRRWALAASVEQLLGTDGSRQIRWTQPVEAGVDLAEAPDGPQLKRIILRSPFASVTADGAAGGLEGELAFNLEELAGQVGQFVDLSAWQLRGTGAGKFSWRDTGADRFAASAGLDLTAIDVRRDGKVVWLDPEVHVEVNSAGVQIAARPVRLETATVQMRGPRDSLEAELLEPVDLAAASGQWFVRIKGDGPLDSWAGRLRPWVAGIPDELFGQSTISARVRTSAELVDVVQSQVSVRDLRMRICGRELVEPRVEAGGDLRWDAAQRSLESNDVQLTSSTVAARARELAVRLADLGPPTVRGDVAFRGDLERLAAWAGLVGAERGLWPRGLAVGQMKLASDAQRATATLSLAAEPFALVQSAAAGAPPTVAWNEPNLQLATELAYTHGDDRLQLANLRLDGRTVKLTGGGAVEQLRTAGDVRGDATLTYDSAELARLLGAYLGPGVRVQGASAARLVVAGRLWDPPVRSAAAGFDLINSASPSLPPESHWSRRWQVTAEAGWTAANLYGLPIGAAQLVANVRQGQLQFNPLDLAVGQGRLTAQSRVLLDPPPQQVQVAAGPLVSNVAVSAEVSEAMLKYAAPILASATRLSGTFSATSEGILIPLGDPRRTEAKGRVTMHQLSILPGPGLADVVTLIQRLEQISRGRDGLLGALGAQPAAPVKGISMNERTIDVQVIDGRVYHRNLEFLVDDVPVRSYGSVGFDQSIALVIQVPVQAKWVGREPALQGLVGQTIEIPVSGTFTRWRVDERAVGNFLAQVAQTAATGAIGDELNKALEGLFKKK